MLAKKPIILLSIFILFPIYIIAQKCEVREFTKNSIKLIPSDSTMSSIQVHLGESMNKALKRNNLLAKSEEENINYTFYINANKNHMMDSTYIIASVFVVKNMPEEIVKIGAREEVFYKLVVDTTNKESISDIGKEVRRKISSDFMKQFGMIEFQLLEYLPKNKLDQFCQKVVDRFLFSNKKK